MATANEQRLYDKLDKLAEKVDEVRVSVAKLEAAHDQRRDDEMTLDRQLSDHDGRLQALEVAQTKVIAWAAGAAAVLGMLSALVPRLFP